MESGTPLFTADVPRVLNSFACCRYASQSEADYAEVVRLCCIFKTMVTWNSENTATTCRERCGGQVRTKASPTPPRLSQSARAY